MSCFHIEAWWWRQRILEITLQDAQEFAAQQHFESDVLHQFECKTLQTSSLEFCLIHTFNTWDHAKKAWDQAVTHLNKIAECQYSHWLLDAKNGRPSYWQTSIYLSIYIYVCISICMIICIIICIIKCIVKIICMITCMYVCLYVCLSVCLSMILETKSDPHQPPATWQKLQSR